MADIIPKFKTGDTVKLTDGNLVTIKWPNTQRHLTKDGRGFTDDFTGTYHCSWIDKERKSQEGDISESQLTLA